MSSARVPPSSRPCAEGACSTRRILAEPAASPLRAELEKHAPPAPRRRPLSQVHAPRTYCRCYVRGLLEKRARPCPGGSTATRTAGGRPRRNTPSLGRPRRCLVRAGCSHPWPSGSRAGVLRPTGAPSGGNLATYWSIRFTVFTCIIITHQMRAKNIWHSCLLLQSSTAATIANSFAVRCLASCAAPPQQQVRTESRAALRCEVSASA